jgi:hypothetical protein
LENLAYFFEPENGLRATRYTSEFTANLPQTHHEKTPANRKTPSKNASAATSKLFLRNP